VVDLDEILSGEDDGVKLSDLLKMAEEQHERGQQEGPQASVIGRLETATTRDGTEKIKPTVSNLITVLSKDRRWRGRVWQDEFRAVTMLDDRDYKDTDDTRIKLWMKKHYDVGFSTDVIVESVTYVAEENGKNPLVDWLKTVTWDGTPRMDEWLIRAVGAEDTKLNKEMGRRWLVQCIARAFNPGIKADCVLILVGPQGARKSTTFRLLASDEYFCDTPMDIGSSNAYMQIHRAWIYEVAELDSIRRAHNSSTKAFLSAQEDTFRPPYGRKAITLKRHTVFCGTTNKAAFITDMTGSRRYWPVQIGKIDTDWTTQNRAQLWAEAVVAFKNGEKWYLENEAEQQLEEQSSDFRQYDPWHEVIEDFMRVNRGTLSTSEIMTQALSLEKYQMTRNNEMRVGDIMRQLGFERSRRRIGGQRTYVWRKQDPDNVIEISKPGLVKDVDGSGD
tara:strand:+ start:2905 stop:4242 length:1338 start_codon:yes stop_codon:yes gene_type:complete